MASPTMLPLDGDTYPVRGALGDLGARWNATERRWYIAEASFDAAMYVINGGSFRAVWRGTVTPPRYPRPATTPAPSPRYTCDECGAALVESFCPACRDEMFIRQIA